MGRLHVNGPPAPAAQGVLAKIRAVVVGADVQSVVAADPLAAVPNARSDTVEREAVCPPQAADPEQQRSTKIRLVLSR
jgi:hypothetical protein